MHHGTVRDQSVAADVSVIQAAVAASLRHSTTPCGERRTVNARHSAENVLTFCHVFRACTTRRCEAIPAQPTSRCSVAVRQAVCEAVCGIVLHVVLHVELCRLRVDAEHLHSLCRVMDMNF